MTTNKFIMFLALGFIVGTLVSRIMEGAYFTAADVEIIDQLSVFRDVQIMGLFSIPTLNIEFFTQGLPHLFTWDYPFFGGTYQIFKYMLYVLTIGAVWGILVVFVGVLSNRFGR